MKLRIRIVLTAIILLSGINLQKQGMETVQAATGRPFEDTFIDGSALNSTTTPYGLDGTRSEVYVKKVKFGSRPDGTDQTWYIAGHDGTGLVLMCNPSHPFDKKKFMTSQAPYMFDGQEVNVNHYGASDIRSYLNGDALNRFTASEQNMMLSSNIYTYNTKTNTAYMTSDKLYLPYGVKGDTYITVGNNSPDALNSGLRINISKNISSNYYDQLFSYGMITLRAPSAISGEEWLASNGMTMDTLIGRYGSKQAAENFLKRMVDMENTRYTLYGNSNSVRGMSLWNPIDIYPAFALDTNNILFASAASVATETSEFMQPYVMSFRFDGSNMIKSKIEYTDNSVIITKDAADSDVYLCVQGNDEGSNWVYSKKITDSGVISAEDIRVDTDMSQCKIWLETVNDNVTYAVVAQRKINHIKNVEITDIEQPVVNQKLDQTGICETEGILNSNPVAVTYTENEMIAGDTAGYGKSYTAKLVLQADADKYYAFDESTTATVNQKTATVEYNPEAKVLVVTYIFPETMSASLKSVEQPRAIIELPHGTPKTVESLRLPKQIGIVTDDPSVTYADVEWDLEHLAGGSYDSNVQKEQSFIVNGNIILPGNIKNPNNLPLKILVQIIVSEIKPVEPPEANLQTGYYDENQAVYLTTSTAGAEIYYTITTDGSEPALPSAQSTRYTSPIAVNGIKNRMIKTRIKAIAVKDGMSDSSIVSYEYTIGMPGDVIDTTLQQNNPFHASMHESTAELVGKVLTDEEIKLVEGGQLAKIWLSVNELSIDERLFKGKRNGKVTVGMVLDFSLWKQLGDMKAQKVSKTNGNVAITLQVPDRLINSDANITRNYQMMRIQDGETEMISCQYNPDTKLLSFETDTCAKYALVYNDIASNNKNSSTSDGTTETGDNTILIVYRLLGCCSVLYLLILWQRKGGKRSR